MSVTWYAVWQRVTWLCVKWCNILGNMMVCDLPLCVCVCTSNTDWHLCVCAQHWLALLCVWVGGGGCTQHWLVPLCVCVYTTLIGHHFFRVWWYYWLVGFICCAMLLNRRGIYIWDGGYWEHVFELGDKLWFWTWWTLWFWTWWTLLRRRAATCY